MEERSTEVLPYRADPTGLARWIDARARGRTPEQIGALGFPAKSLEGTLVAAGALGFLEGRTGELTERGRRYSLGSEEERGALLREALVGYEPYARLLEAVFERGRAASTEVSWIETWWATHGYGNSPSNRAEGAAVLGRLLEAVGAARYIPGRRGHATRIEWRPGAEALLKGGGAAPRRAVAAPEPARGQAPPAPEPARPAAPPTPPDEPPPAADSAGGGYTTVTLELGGWGTAELRLPTRLPASEKRRLIALMEVLISEQG